MTWFLSWHLFTISIENRKGYKITWLTAQAVLVLKMIMVFMDLKESSSEKAPNFLEFTAYSTFYPTCLAGPQMTFSHYRKFLDLTNIFSNKNDSNYEILYHFHALSRKKSIQKLSTAILLMTFFAKHGSMHDDRIWNHENSVFFTEFSFLRKFMFITVYGNGKFYKYMTFWCLAESCLLLSGTSCSKDLTFTSCQNAEIYNMTKSILMSDYVKYFNINTNLWSRTYVFKPLKFLNNKLLSKFLTLLFLAAWHGMLPGYFTCFFYEFLVLIVEREMIEADLLQETLFLEGNQSSSQKFHHFLKGIFQKFWHFALISGYSHIDFGLLLFKNYYRVWKNCYFYGHVYLVVFYLIARYRNSKRKRIAESADVPRKVQKID